MIKICIDVQRQVDEVCSVVVRYTCMTAEEIEQLKLGLKKTFKHTVL